MRKTFDLVVFATGGVGRLYKKNANNWTTTGDGIAIAAKMGCELNDMEFVQFHPTLLNSKKFPNQLISEAVRGAGGILVDENGIKIMQDIHRLKDLAPRDIVSREIFKQQQAGHEIYLDISNVIRFEEKFPSITAILNQDKESCANWQETKLIPVTPGAHFFMGGIKTDSDGLTNIPGVFAIGECANTGVHGANRLASNSLLECLVFGYRAAKYIKRLVDAQNKTDNQIELKVLVIGSGLAGSWFSYLIQDFCDVTIITKGSQTDCNSALAQGGVACAIDSSDSIQSHYEDTLEAGDYHNNKENTKILVTEGVEVIQKLIELGCPFDRNADNSLQFALEGAHSRPRVLHLGGDQSGKLLHQFVQSLWTKVEVIENAPVAAVQKINSDLFEITFEDLDKPDSNWAGSNWADLPEKNWQNIGIIRNTSNMKKYINELGQVELSDKSILVSQEITKAALARKESLGAHYLE
ncbi:MAG: FAD-binding protein [Candidatus Ancillula sp.]|jgi:aspartate oxidase|nr:FAD-binding protein [Candidatus Ancillula sp.]